MKFSKDIHLKPAIKSFYSVKSVSHSPFRHKNINKKATNKSSNNFKNINKKRRISVINVNNNAYFDYQKSSKNFNFKNK